MTRAEPYGTAAIPAFRIAFFIACLLAGESAAYAQVPLPLAESGFPEHVEHVDHALAHLPIHGRSRAGPDGARHADADSARVQLAGPASPHGPHDDDDAEPSREIILTFRYGDVVTADVSARYIGRDIYVPVGGLFSLLGIAWRLDRSVPAITGFYLEEKRTYGLNFANHTGRLGTSTLGIDPSEFIVVGHDVFVRPNVLEDLFGFRVIVDMNALAVYVKSSRMLPVELKQHRARARPLLKDPYERIRHAPLAYERNRKMLGGGVADYNLSVHRSIDQSRLHLQTALGAELLGGDIAWQGRAGFADGAYVANDYVRWRFALENNPLLRQIRAGTLHGGGLRPQSYRGIHFTNEPARPERLFGEYVITGEVEPEWELELYMDDRLIDVTRAPASGRYEFHVPLMYGTSRLQVRAYGPAGEVRNLRRHIQVPFSMMRPGNVRYSVNLGESSEERSLLGHADLGYGLSEHLTAKLNVEYMEGMYRDRPRVYGSLTSRLGRHVLSSVDLSPDGVKRFSLNALLPSQTSMELRYARIEQSSRQLIARDRSRMSATAFMPFYVGRFPMSARFSALRTTYDSADQYRFRSHLQASFNGLQLYLTTESDVSSSYRSTEIAPALSYAVTRPPDVLAFLRGMMVSARGQFDVERRRMRGVELNAAHSVSRYTRLQLFTKLGLNRLPSSIGFRISTVLPFARAVTDTRVQRGAANVVQSFRGSVAVDRRNARILASDRSSVGRGTAALRLFVDRNANGTLDPDEHVIEHNAVRLDRGSALSSGHRSGVTHVSDLLPYERYTARIEEAAIANPLWVPQQSAFSFIADPNAVKPIDVPLYAAGVVGGTVVDRQTGEPYPVSGILVRIVDQEDGSERVLRTYSDGSFYEMGFRPGTYELHLDPNQLDAHDLRVDSDAQRFVVRATENGDYVDGIRIAVAEKSSDPELPAYAEAVPIQVAPMQPMLPALDEAAPIVAVLPTHAGVAPLMPMPPALAVVTRLEPMPPDVGEALNLDAAKVRPVALARAALVLPAGAESIEPTASTDLGRIYSAPLADLPRPVPAPPDTLMPVDPRSDVSGASDVLPLEILAATRALPGHIARPLWMLPRADLVPRAIIVTPVVPRSVAESPSIGRSPESSRLLLEHSGTAPPRPDLAIGAADALPDDPFVPGPQLAPAPVPRIVPLFTWVSLALLLALGMRFVRRSPH